MVEAAVKVRYVLVLMLAVVVSGLGLYPFQNATLLEVHFGWWRWAIPNWNPVAGAAASVLLMFLISVVLVSWVRSSSHP